MTENYIYAGICLWLSAFCWVIYWLEGEVIRHDKKK